MSISNPPSPSANHDVKVDAVIYSMYCTQAIMVVVFITHNIFECKYNYYDSLCMHLVEGTDHSWKLCKHLTAYLSQNLQTPSCLGEAI